MRNMLTCLLCTVSTMGMLGMLQWNTSDDDRVIAAHRNTFLEAQCMLIENGFFPPV
jgi:hypothetical protein